MPFPALRLALLAALLPLPIALPALAASPPATAGLESCAAPRPGRYVLLGSGEHRGEPVAVLLQERWHADGRLEGVLYRRQGQRFEEARTSGLWKADAHCWATLERRLEPKGAARAGAARPAASVMAESVALDQRGQPRASLVLAPDEVLSLRYVPQPDKACSPALLDGLVTSQQQGRSWQDGRWQANAVVQREWWSGGIVQGWAVSSYAGRLERAAYSGKLQLGSDCLGTMAQRDALGTAYDYRVVVLAGGGGYFYLQTDPNDLTLGLLQHQR
jgi:hypothetical protein